MKKVVIFLVAFFLSFPLNHLNAAEKYLFIDLGTMGNDSSRATSINNNGVIIGSVKDQYGSYSFKWEEGHINFLPIPPPYAQDSFYSTNARTINDNNEIGGGFVNRDGWMGSCIWQMDKVTVIPESVTNGTISPIDLVDLNNDSQAILRWRGYLTFLWENDHLKLILSDSEDGFDTSYPNAINNLGQVVGEINASGYAFAYLWENDQLFDLNELVIGDSVGPLSYAIDINNLGQIVGIISDYPFYSSFFFDEGQVIDIGFDGVQAINDLGQIVGSNYLYEDRQLFDLYDLIESNITFNDLDVVDINDSGQIVGNASIDESIHAVLLNPCEALFYYRDADGDGHGDLDDELNLCIQPDGYVTDFTDCEDSDDSVNPSAEEICNSKDDNCNDQIDEGVTMTFHRDADSDGYGDTNDQIQACSAPNGYVSNNLDCDDTDQLINPGATETCNSRDDNCDGNTDEGVQNTYYRDSDADAYGDSSKTIQACSTPSGYVSNSRDCIDSDASVHPNATEVCGDGIDQDCSGSDLSCPSDIDNDGDGFSPNQGDCDDSDTSIFPGAKEILNDGIDQDCNGQDFRIEVETGRIISAAFINTDDPIYLNDMPNDLKCEPIKIELSVSGGGQTASFIVHLQTAIPVDYQPYKYTKDGWVNFSRDIVSGGKGDGAEFIDTERKQLKVYVTDGDKYDNDPENGIISDPITVAAPGFITPQEEIDDGGNSGADSGGGGCFINLLHR